MAGPVYQDPDAATRISVIRISVIRIVAIRIVAIRISVIRIGAPLSEMVPNVVLRSVGIPNVVIQNAAIRAVVLIVVRILALNAVLIVAVIQARIPARDARRADFLEVFREEFHAVVPKPAPVVRCAARAH